MDPAALLILLALACQQGGPTPAQVPVFPEDSPREFLVAVQDCRDLALTPTQGPAPAQRRGFAFTVPQAAEVLRVEASWLDASRKRAVAAGPGACPPCESLDRAKGHGRALLELTPPVGAAFTTGEEWFAALEVDPAEDDLGVDTPRIVAQSCRVATTVESRGLFPPEGLDGGSQRLLEHDAFGFAGFEDVRTATYGSGALLAFVAPVGDRAAAQRLAADYRRFLVSLGGEEASVDGLEGAGTVRVYGLTTVVFALGTQVAGVQEAPDGEAALVLARTLAAWLAEG